MKKTGSRSTHQQQVTILGLGYVGSAVLRALARSSSYQVYGFDTDIEKIQELRTDPELERVLLTTEPKDCLPVSEIVVICVPSPIDADHKPDFRFLEHAAQTIAQYLRKDQLIILESTVAPGFSEEHFIPLLEKSDLRVAEDFGFAYCPERIDVQNARWNVTTIPRVIAASDQASLERALQFYTHIVRTPLHVKQSIKEVELVKMYENTFRDVNIALANEVAVLAKSLGVDFTEVLAGAATKPFGFLPHYPGCGVGGDCIATDPYYLLHTAAERDLDLPLIRAARQRNEAMPMYMTRLLDELREELTLPVGKAHVLLLGVAYKPEVSDTRRSPALEFMQILKKRGIQVSVFDPFVPKYSDVPSLEEGLQHANILAICTAHQVFLDQLEPELLTQSGIRGVIDGRNCLDKADYVQSGLGYRGIGR